MSARSLGIGIALVALAAGGCHVSLRASATATAATGDTPAREPGPAPAPSQAAPPTAAPRTAAPPIAAPPAGSEPARLVVLDLNVGHGQQGHFTRECSQRADFESSPERATAMSFHGLEELFAREVQRAGAGPADTVLVTMQEVDVRTARNPTHDVPAEIRARLGAGWTARFGHVMRFCPPSAPRACLLGPPDPRGVDCHACGGDFGLAVLASRPTRAVREHRLAWYAPDAFDARGERASYPEHGREPRIALAARATTGAGDVWVVTTHLGGEVERGHVEERLAVEQVDEVLAFVRDQLSADGTPVVVVGDFNIVRRGEHRTGDPRFASDGHGYATAASAFARAGFRELRPGEPGAADDAPCWQSRRCTVNPWGQYSTLDYAWLRDPEGRVERAALEIVAPALEAGCFLTDHAMLRIDLSLRPS